MNLSRYLALDRTLTAFKFRDIQSLVTVHSWIITNGFSMSDMKAYVVTKPFMDQLDTLGYFVDTPNVDHQKRIRDFEHTLPKDIRKILRTERLNRSRAGTVPT